MGANNPHRAAGFLKGKTLKKKNREITILRTPSGEWLWNKKYKVLSYKRHGDEYVLNINTYKARKIHDVCIIVSDNDPLFNRGWSVANHE